MSPGTSADQTRAQGGEDRRRAAARPAAPPHPGQAAVSLGLVVNADAIRRRQAGGEQAFALHLCEILDHVRLGYRRVDAVNEDYAEPGVLVVGDADPDPCVLDWVAAGGHLVIAAHTEAWNEIVGVHTTAATTGLVDLGGLIGESRPLRAIGGYRLEPISDALNVLARWEDGSAAIVSRNIGDGTVTSFGPDLPQTIVRIRQGFPVVADGQPASDGTAPIDDGILKCEDGLALSLEEDRGWAKGTAPMPTPFHHAWPPPGPTPIFDLPQADLWCSALIVSVLDALRRLGTVAGWLDYWPDGIRAIGHLSHDADLNSDDDAQAALDAFESAEIAVTWCLLFPGGYSPETYRKIGNAGHEQALHFNATGDADIAAWGWPQLRAQYAWAQAVTGTDSIVTNKNHYTRWEGWSEFYGWCERLGIEIDETRGPSKLGDVGFTFGTAHPYFPLADRTEHNRHHDVLSLALHTQDLELAAHGSCRDVILDGAERVHGIAHFLFHGPHLRKPATRKAFDELMAAARSRGLPWWTAGKINSWERARRNANVLTTIDDEGERITISVDSTLPLRHATIVLDLSVRDLAEVNCTGPAARLIQVTRHGRESLGLVVDIQAGRQQWIVDTRQQPTSVRPFRPDGSSIPEPN